MRKFIHALTLAAILFSAASCSTEVRIDGDTLGDDTEVLLQLRAPREFGSTRGLSVGEERAIENVYVLEFDADAMTLKAIEKGAVASNETSFAVTLEPSEGNEKSKLIVLANAETILTERGFIVGG